MDASDDPADQDKAREIRVMHDYASLKKQIGSKKKPQKPAVEEEVGISSTVEMEKAKKEAALRRKEQQASARALAKTTHRATGKFKKYDSDGDGKIKVIDAGYNPEGEIIDERLGGKGYSRKAGAAKIHPTSGDWPESDRGEGNKARRRAGEKVEKKSPSYLAHVHN